MNKNVTTALLILLAIVGGYFIFQQYQATQTKPEKVVYEDEDQSQNTSTEDNVPENWNEYSTSTFSFSYPSEATVGTEAGRVKVQLIGPDSEQDTEITDGFTFYVTTEEYSETSTLEEFAQQKHEEVTEQLESIQPPEETTVGNTDAYHFTVQSEIGSESNRIVLEAKDNTAFVISYTSTDPNNTGYKDMINTMMKSLEYSS